jgi:hypothetical protein
MMSANTFDNVNAAENDTSQSTSILGDEDPLAWLRKQENSTLARIPVVSVFVRRNLRLQEGNIYTLMAMDLMKKMQDRLGLIEREDFRARLV